MVTRPCLTSAGWPLFVSAKAMKRQTMSTCLVPGGHSNKILVCPKGTQAELFTTRQLKVQLLGHRGENPVFMSPIKIIGALYTCLGELTPTPRWMQTFLHFNPPLWPSLSDYCYFRKEKKGRYFCNFHFY